MAEFDYLHEREEYARRAANDWPWCDKDITGEVAKKRHVADWYHKRRDELLALADLPYHAPDSPYLEKARDLWEREFSGRGVDLRALDEFRRYVLARGMTSNPEAVKALDLRYRNLAVEAAAMAEAAEAKRLNDALNAILAAVGKAGRLAALALYNQDDSPRSWDKLARWVDRCVEAKLLPMSWAARMRREQLADFIREIMPKPNKARRPGEVK